MCLAIPGRITETFEADGLKMAKVNFGGIGKSVCIEYTPEALVGSFILVHVGFAISIIDEEEARRTYQMLQSANELEEIYTRV
jgi:hydrogenase expression/formation protein HypC